MTQDGTTWRPLFNGRDMDGWEHVGPGHFIIEDGCLRTVEGMGLLWYTREKFGDCRLKVVYKTVIPTSNSGVFIRIADKPADEWFAVHNGYEVQILDEADGYHATGALYSLSAATAKPMNPTGEWNEMVITMDGFRVIVEINGVKVNDFTTGDPVPEKTQWYEPERGPRPTHGYIGVQNHGEGQDVIFREVSVAPLKA